MACIDVGGDTQSPRERLDMYIGRSGLHLERHRTVNDKNKEDPAIQVGTHLQSSLAEFTTTSPKQYNSCPNYILSLSFPTLSINGSVYQ